MQEFTEQMFDYFLRFGAINRTWLFMINPCTLQSSNLIITFFRLFSSYIGEIRKNKQTKSFPFFPDIFLYLNDNLDALKHQNRAHPG